MLTKSLAAALLVALSVAPAGAKVVNIPTTTIKLDCEMKQRDETHANVWLYNRSQQPVRAGTGVQVTSNTGKSITLVMAAEIPAGGGWSGQNLAIGGRACTARTVLFNAP